MGANRKEKGLRKKYRKEKVESIKIREGRR